MVTSDQILKQRKRDDGGLRNRVAIQYALEGDLRFISHQDTLRMFQRALRRAGVPVRYSEGFNPRPRMSIVLPRPVGITSYDELLVLELATDSGPSNLLACLSEHIPPGLRLLSVESLSENERRFPYMIQYALMLEPPQHESVERSAADFLSKDKVIVERTMKQGSSKKKVDIRPSILTMEVDDDIFRWTQAINPEGTARVNEVLEQVGLSSRRQMHHVIRQKVSYKT